MASRLRTGESVVVAGANAPIENKAAQTHSNEFSRRFLKTREINQYPFKELAPKKIRNRRKNKHQVREFSL
jgi:hypothetical protein